MNFQPNIQRLPKQNMAREFAKPAQSLADKLRALREAQRENDREPVDEFFRRGETTARFAYFD